MSGPPWCPCDIQGCCPWPFLTATCRAPDQPLPRPPGTTEASLSSLHQMQAPFWMMLRPLWATHSPSSLRARSFLKIIDLHHYPSRHAHDFELCLGITLRLGSVPMVSTTASCLLHLHPLTPALLPEPEVNSCTVQTLWVTSHRNPTSVTGLPRTGTEGRKRSWTCGLGGGGLFFLSPPLLSPLLLCLSWDRLCSSSMSPPGCHGGHWSPILDSSGL